MQAFRLCRQSFHEEREDYQAFLGSEQECKNAREQWIYYLR